MTGVFNGMQCLLQIVQGIFKLFLIQAIPCQIFIASSSKGMTGPII